jgi:hypothetical protein
MPTDSITALEDCLEANTSEGFSYKLRTASALPGFGGWAEVTVHAGEVYDESAAGEQLLTELRLLMQRLIRHAKGGRPGRPD